MSRLQRFKLSRPKTFRELSKSLKEVLEDGLVSSNNFLEEEELEKVLKAHFVRVSIKELIIEKEYFSLIELLHKIKYTGTRGDGINGSFLWSRSLLKRVEDVYKEEFGGINATYQIFLCKAVR